MGGKTGIKRSRWEWGGRAQSQVKENGLPLGPGDTFKSFKKGDDEFKFLFREITLGTGGRAGVVS